MLSLIKNTQGRNRADRSAHMANPSLNTCLLITAGMHYEYDEKKLTKPNSTEIIKKKLHNR